MMKTGRLAHQHLWKCKPIDVPLAIESVGLVLLSVGSFYWQEYRHSVWTIVCHKKVNGAFPANIVIDVMTPVTVVHVNIKDGDCRMQNTTDKNPFSLCWLKLDKN